MKKAELVYNKPVYLGMSIVGLSKKLMYDFHYNYMKKKYGENIANFWRLRLVVWCMISQQ